MASPAAAYSDSQPDQDQFLVQINTLWLNFLNGSDEDQVRDGVDTIGGSKIAWLEVFLYEFMKLNEAQRERFQRSISSESISSALSRQLLLLIYKICKAEETCKRASSITSPSLQPSTGSTGTAADDTTLQLASGTNPAQLLPDYNDNRIEDESGKDTDNRCQYLRQFLLAGVGGRILKTLEAIGGQDIVNGREVTSVLISILPENRWCTLQTAELTYSTDYNFRLRSLFKMQTCSGNWHCESKRSLLGLNCATPTARSTVLSLEQSTAAESIRSAKEPWQATNLGDYHSETFNAHLGVTLTQDQLTLTVLNLLESLVASENVTMIDDKSITMNCLRMAIERLRQREMYEESPHNRLVIRHKLLGILMLSLNNLFFLESIESDQINLKQIASQIMDLLRAELESSSADPISCDFIYNLTYTIVSTVNQMFVQFCDSLVSEQFFLAIFRLLESNLDIIKHVYGLLHESSPADSQPKMVDILLKMLKNFITTLTPNRAGGKKTSRTRHRMHHSRLDPRTTYVCALENILLNIFPIVKYSDQKRLLQFFSETQICCCNSTIRTLEVLLKLSNAQLVPRICLNFANRSVIQAIFSRSHCDSCEGERFNDIFYDRFACTHRDMFRAYCLPENRTRLPTLLKYFQEVVRVVPYRLARFILFDLILPQLLREKAAIDASQPLDDTTKEVINGCLFTIARCLKDVNFFEPFFTVSNQAVLRELSLRTECVYQVCTILRIGIENSSKVKFGVEDSLMRLVLQNLDDLTNHLASQFRVLKASDISATLKSVVVKEEDTKLSNQSTVDALQLYAEHWRLARHLLQVNSGFYENFIHSFADVADTFLPLVYNIFSLLIFHEHARPIRCPNSSCKLTDLTEQTNPERRSILNIFNFNDQLIDNQLPSDEFFYSCPSVAVPGRTPDADDYSFLRELTMDTLLKLPSAGQESIPPAANGKLEKSWSLLELFNIKQLLGDLMDEYVLGMKSLTRRREDLPEQVRQLLSTGGSIRKRLAILVELMLSTIQLLAEKNDQLEDAMQSALIELKKLLLSGAFDNWDSPETTKNVMNALQSLLKIAEIRGESGSFDVMADDYPLQQQQQDYYFPLQQRKKSYGADDDVSSTDESFTTAFDDGYEGDVENEQLVAPTIGTRRGGSFHSKELNCVRVNQSVCNIVIDILQELSKKCAADPQHWCSVLAQTILKLHGIREHLGGSLYLIKGFKAVLEKSDLQLKELQTSILELITDLDSPEVFTKFLQLLTLEDPPVCLILTKLINIVESNLKLECYVEVEYPDPNDDGTRLSTCDVLLAKKINYLCEHHRFFNIRSPFTCSAAIIPLNYINFSPWNAEGFTASAWFCLRANQRDSNRITLTHLLSVGSEKQMVSLFLNRQQQFTVRFNKPDRIITNANSKQYLASNVGLTCCDSCAKELSHLWSYKHLLRSIEPIVSPFRIDAPGAQCVYCYKALPAGRTIATTNLSNDFFYDLHSEQYTIKDFELIENRWTSLALSVQQQNDSISIVLTLDGVQQETLTITDPYKIHIDTALPLLALGHSLSSMEDDCPLNYSLSNVQLFRRCFTDVRLLANFYSLGPNWTHLGAFTGDETVPNFKHLNLSKLQLDDLQAKNCFELLQRSHLGYYTANKPNQFISVRQNLGQIALGLISFVPRLTAQENPSLQRSIQLSGGITTILFAFARIVELSDSARVHANALSLLLQIAHDNHDFYNEFIQRDLLELVGIVLKNKKCHKELCVLAALLEVAFDQPVLVRRGENYCVLLNSVARIRYPEIVIFFFENFPMWIEHSEDVLDLVFGILIMVTRDKHPGRSYNCRRLTVAGLVPALIDFCRINFVIPPKTVRISRSAADSLVALITILSNAPPKVSLLKEIIELLLLMHKPTDSYVTHDRQKFYFNINPHFPGKSSTKSNEAGRAGGQRMNLRERRLKYSQLRKAIPLVISSSNNSSYESTTSFIELGRISSKAATAQEEPEPSTANCASPKSPRKASEKQAASNYEKVNQALAQLTIRRKSLKGGGERHKIRRLHSPGARVCVTPKELRLNSPRLGPKKELLRSAQSLPTKFKFFEQNYFGTGNDFIQESFLRAMCDYLLILSDHEAKQFFHADNQIIETLLILANNSNIRIRTMIINLIAVISDRVLAGNSPAASAALSYSEDQLKVFWYHLGNQIGSHAVSFDLLTSCFRWATKNACVQSIETLLLEGGFSIVQESGLNVLLAVLPQSHTDLRLFVVVLNLIDHICEKHGRAAHYMIENGLIWTLAKTAIKMHEKDDAEQGSKFEHFLDFLTKFSQRAIQTISFVNPFWDLMNGLTLAARHKNPKIVRGVRDVQALLYKNLLQTFVYRPTESVIGHKNNAFTVELPGSLLSKTEVKTRFNQIHDKAVQFITNCDAEHQVSDAETLLIKSLMNRTLNGNPRGGNIILWCLLPKRPLSLKLYTIRQLVQYVETGSYLSLICDLRMLKVFTQSIMLLDQKDLSVEELAFIDGFCQNMDGTLISTWTLPQTLDEFDYLRTINLSDQEQTILKSINKQEKLIHLCTIAAMDITRNIVEKQNKLRKELIIQLKKDNDFKFFNQWRHIIDQMTHENAPWYNAKLYPTSWELDDTVGPDMSLKRLRRRHLAVDSRFLQKELRSGDGQVPKQLLSYLLPKNRSQEFAMENQVLYTSTVVQIAPKHELDSECILTSTELVLCPVTGDIDIYDLYSISKIWMKRYQHQETAVEILLKSGRSLFLVFGRPVERETFAGFFQDLVQREGRQELEAQTQLWKEGALSNWEYLMHLNQISGRSYYDLMQYPVFPWVLADYESRTLDLLLERSFRDLERPIAVQYKDLEKHYINNYNYLKQADNDTLCKQKIQPYHYSSHYSNSGTVLHFLVRLLPFTSLFLHYQDDSFDIPDRTFHSLGTTWKLASRDSPTDVKELIPEFYSLPEFLENQEGFDFGIRQSGEPVNHVELPPWCNQSARLFILIHRQALESDIVRRHISHWIDLTFGYKQTGPAAVEAINVFHPATYANFNASDIEDPVEKLALETMVKTYGQMPRQLFDSPHPQANVVPLGASSPVVVDSVNGLKWGLYSGSPILASPKIVDIRNAVSNVSSLVHLDGNRIVGVPSRWNIFRGQQSQNNFIMEWGHLDDVIRYRSVNETDTRTSELVYNTSADPITACGSDPNCPDVWFGHRSGRIAVFQQRTARRKVSFFNHNIQPSVTRSRSSSFRRWIDRKSASLRRKLESDDDANASSGRLPMKWNFPVILIKHRAEITAITISTEFKVVVSVSMDGCASIWDYNSLSYVREIPKPVNVINSKISWVAVSPTLGDIITVHSSVESRSSMNRSNETSTLVDDDSFEVTENYNLDYVNVTMASSRDQLRLHTINAKYVEHVFVESPVASLAYTSVKEGCGVNCIAVGLESGLIRLYSSWNLALVREFTTNAYDGYGIRSLIYSKNQHLVLLTTGNVIQTWKSEGLPGASPQILELPIRRSIG